MSTKGLAEALIAMLEDEELALAVLVDHKAALASFKLTKKELEAFAKRIPPSTVEPIQQVPAVGAWRLLTSDIDAIPMDLRQRLNEALARHAAQSRAIPNTGT
ncbi:hypothetical protein [Rhizobium leguminosarum]|uniref:hypothetical protein n=1 Tax=Rhizobium leguminosarum TaxID=384 RepID=UPI001C962AC1|nr:hypothetical protein [Rhizobium leguminosarum]MBY5422314.1 hypothetical protein [Rhizobium leguminosarum]